MSIKLPTREQITEKLLNTSRAAFKADVIVEGHEYTNVSVHLDSVLTLARIYTSDGIKTFRANNMQALFLELELRCNLFLDA